MTLTDAINQIVQSTRYDACKRPSMGGYIYRSEVSTETATAGDYSLTFKKRSGTTYTINYDASAAADARWSAASGSSFPTLTGELWEELLGDDWAVGTKEDFAAALSGTGDW